MSVIVSFCGDGEEPGDTLSPNVVLPLVPALEFDDSPLHGLEPEVPPVLPALQ